MDLKRLKIRYSTNIISGLFVVTVFFLSGTGAIGIPPSYARKIIVEIIIPIISNNGDNNIIEAFSKTVASAGRPRREGTRNRSVQGST